MEKTKNGKQIQTFFKQGQFVKTINNHTYTPKEKMQISGPNIEKKKNKKTKRHPRMR